MVRPLFRKNTLDEMTVGRTEKPVTGKLPDKPADPAKRVSPLLEGQPEPGSPNRESISSLEGEMPGRAEGGKAPASTPLARGKTGIGSYEDPGEQRRKGRTKGKTGRPGR